MNKYNKDILNLTVSIVPKLTSVAVSMNIALRNRYPSVKNLYDTEDKSTWIYYKNLKGERFKTLDDVYLQPKIFLNTIEDNTEIELTKANLKNYNLTKVKLQEMGTLYKSLVNDYKDQELRIRGIIFDLLTDPLKATDGTILLMNPSYIEYNEYTLIDKLEQRIKNYLSRWDIKDFTLGDKSYAPILLVRLTHFIFLNIINLKSNNINTLEVDTFHLRNYFNSNLRLGNIMSVLPNDIKFWMYKNLSTLIYNMGSNKTLNTIIEKVLDPSGIETHLFNIHPIEPTFGVLEEDVYKNDRIFTNTDNSNISLESLLFKEQSDNKITDIVYKDTGYRDSIFNKVAKGKGEVEPTKVILLKERREKLLSSIDIDLITLEACIAYLNNIQESFLFKDAETGITYKLTSKNLIYTIILILRNMNKRVPSIKDKLYVHNLLETMTLTEGFNTTLLGDETLRATVDKINSHIGIIPTSLDKSGINTYIDDMVNAHTDIHYYLANIESSKSKDVMERLRHTSASIKTITLDNLEDFDRYILENNLTIVDPNDRDASKWFILLNNILDIVVGKKLLSVNTNKLGIFKEMLAKLTSYSVQVVTDSEGSAIGTLEQDIGYHFDIGAMRILDVTIECGSSKPTIVSLTGNDGKLDRMLTTIGSNTIEIIPEPTLAVKYSKSLGNKKTHMEIL